MKNNQYPCNCDGGSYITLDYYGNMDTIKVCPRCNGKGKIELSDELKTIRDLSGACSLLMSSINEKMQIVENEKTHNLDKINLFLNHITKLMDAFIDDNYDDNNLK